MKDIVLTTFFTLDGEQETALGNDEIKKTITSVQDRFSKASLRLRQLHTELSTTKQKGVAAKISAVRLNGNITNIKAKLGPDGLRKAAEMRARNDERLNYREMIALPALSGDSCVSFADGRYEDSKAVTDELFNNDSPPDPDDTAAGIGVDDDGDLSPYALVDESNGADDRCATNDDNDDENTRDVTNLNMWMEELSVYESQYREASYKELTIYSKIREENSRSKALVGLTELLSRQLH